MASYGFDGVDIALEFSDEDVPEDKLALTTLLEVCENFSFNLLVMSIFDRKLLNRND
jgi:chitinase